MCTAQCTLCCCQLHYAATLLSALPALPPLLSRAAKGQSARAAWRGVAGRGQQTATQREMCDDAFKVSA